jgi:gliding motility-associated-like protein
MTLRLAGSWFLAWVCVAMLPTVLPAQSYFLNGNAAELGNDCFIVTPGVAWQSGTIWYSPDIDLNEPFTLEFDMNFGNFNDNGADGMVFVLQTVGPDALGVGGGGMGFEGFNPSFGIEFDTFMNSPPNAGNNNDPAADHIAFLRDGNVSHFSPNNLAGPVQASAGNVNIEDGIDHHVKIEWDPATETIACYFDCVLRLSAQVDLINSIFSGNSFVTWGFTGSTGGLFNTQTVCLSDYILGLDDPEPICPGNSAQLAAAGPSDVLYTWTPATGLNDPNIQAPVASPLVTTTYTVSYTNVCGEEFSDEVTVVVTDPIELPTIADATLCPGGSTILTVEVNDPGATYFWFTEDGAISGTNAAATVTVTEAGTYTVTVTNGEGCVAQTSANASEVILPDWFVPEDEYIICEGETLELNAGGSAWNTVWMPGAVNSETFTISQTGAYQVEYEFDGCTEEFPFQVTTPNLNANDLGPDQTICEDESIVLNAGVSVVWSTGVTAPSITVSDAGTYSYVLTIGDCSTDDAMTLFTDALPVFDLGAAVALCPGDSVILTIPFTGQWSTGEAGNSIEVTEEGIYGVSVANGACIATDAVQVTALSDPIADLGPDLVYCLDDILTLSAVNPANETFLWSNGEETATIPVTEPGTYSVEVFNICGSARDTIEVAFEECNVYVYIPNSFTPNDDGLNDAWKPVTLNVERYELWVYDRWGTQLFYTNDMDEYWLGNVRDGEHYVPSGAYVYRFVYPIGDLEIGELRGTVTVVR